MSRWIVLGNFFKQGLFSWAALFEMFCELFVLNLFEMFCELCQFRSDHFQIPDMSKKWFAVLKYTV